MNKLNVFSNKDGFGRLSKNIVYFFDNLRYAKQRITRGFADCDIFLTKDMRLNIMIPRKAQECFDSFTVTLPEKGDLCILYMPFDKDIEGVVIPFMQTNFHDILCKMLGVRDVDSKIISRKLMDVVKKSNKTGFEKA